MSERIKQTFINMNICVVFFKKICKYWIRFLIYFLLIFVLQEVLNNETTYSNGESQVFFKISNNVELGFSFQ